MWCGRALQRVSERDKRYENLNCLRFCLCVTVVVHFFFKLIRFSNKMCVHVARAMKFALMRCAHTDSQLIHSSSPYRVQSHWGNLEMDFDSRQPAVDQTVSLHQHHRRRHHLRQPDKTEKRPTKRIRNRKTREQNSIMIYADSRWLTQVHSWTAGVHTRWKLCRFIRWKTRSAMNFTISYGWQQLNQRVTTNIEREPTIRESRGNAPHTHSSHMAFVQFIWVSTFSILSPGLFISRSLCVGSDSMQRQTRPHHEWCAPSHDLTFGRCCRRCIAMHMSTRRKFIDISISFNWYERSAHSLSLAHTQPGCSRITRTHAYWTEDDARLKLRAICFMTFDCLCLFEWVWVCVSVLELPCVCAWKQDTGRTHIAFNRWISILRMKMNKKQLKYFSAYRSIRLESTVYMHYSFHIYILLYVEPSERKEFRAAERKKKNEMKLVIHTHTFYCNMYSCRFACQCRRRYVTVVASWKTVDDDRRCRIKVHSTHTHTRTHWRDKETSARNSQRNMPWIIRSKIHFTQFNERRNETLGHRRLSGEWHSVCWLVCGVTVQSTAHTTVYSQNKNANETQSGGERHEEGLKYRMNYCDKQRILWLSKCDKK